MNVYKSKPLSMKEIKEKKVNRFGTANPDSENSKYKHLIYFEVKNIVLTGYSGKVGMKEKDNDIDNFINYVLRLMKNNYYPGGLREIDSMEYYVNRDNELIMTLQKGHATWEPKFLFDAKWKRVQTIIDTMYDFLEKSWPLVQIEDKLKIKSKPKIAFDPVDLTPRFTSDRSLVRHCEELIRKGYAQGEVESYLRNYRSKYFNK
jgi:hypothetical protein